MGGLGLLVFAVAAAKISNQARQRVSNRLRQYADDYGAIHHHKGDTAWPNKAPELCHAVKQLENFASDPKQQVMQIMARSPPGLVSQMGQDGTLVSALGAVFRNSSRPHTYVDVAAAWPRKLSNTFVLDVCYGWKGVCIEADPKKAKLLRSERSCRVVERCITDTDGQKITFHTTSGKGGTGSNGIAGFGRSTGSSKTMECTTMATALGNSGEEEALREVDYMSVDVEGAEALVMRGINWSDLYVHMINIEVDKIINVASAKSTVQHILEERGFIPLLQNFPYKQGLPALRLCSSILYGRSVASVLDPESDLEKWRMQDILFINEKSSYLPMWLEWLDAGGACTGKRVFS